MVTFLSDFGSKDAYVAQVKAVILSSAPSVTIVDITHEVEPFDLVSAGWLLAASYRHFPRGTVHLAVVDPGVGTARAALVARKDGHTFVGPDNGVFSFIYPADEVIEVTWRPGKAVSNTFHGRDLFAPLVVRLVTGHGLGVPGRPMAEPVRLEVDGPMVVHVDRFGNVITNIPAERLARGGGVEINGTRVSRTVSTFAELQDGSLGLICGSSGTIEVVSHRARASDVLCAGPGTPVSLIGP